MEQLISQNSILGQLTKIGNQNLNKTSILYDRNLGSKIPKRFLYSDENLPPSVQTSRAIIEKYIFKILNMQALENLEQIEKAKNILTEILIKFVELHRSCPFKVFLDCYCKKEPVIESRKRKRDSEEKSQSEGCLKCNISPKNVYCFLRRSLMYVLGFNDKLKQKIDTTCPLLGGQENFDCLMRKIKDIVYGLKYDSIKLNTILHGFKFARISYLNDIECHRLKRLILMSIIRWLLEDYLFMLLKSNFYVTDTSKTNSEIFFYLKTDWRNILKNQLSDPANKNYRKVYNLEKIKEVDVIGYCSRFESFGAHLGRLLPKNVNNECRIISGCRAYNPCTNKSINVNYRFVTLNNTLKYLICKDPKLIGFACRGHVELHRKYSQFLKLNLLNRSTANIPECQEGFKKWNFIKFDINKCFDSIDTKELELYISKLLFKELGHEYAFTQVKYGLFQTDLDHKQIRAKYEYLTFKHHVREKGLLNGIADFIHILENADKLGQFTDFKLKGSNKGGYIFVPLCTYDRNITYKKLNESLRKCLNHVVIKVHNEFYERINGVLQGSICSRNFCDLYLGQIENKLFTYEDTNAQMKLNKFNVVILRIVDDYLVISCEAENLFKIKDLLKQKLNLNESKTVLYLWKKPEVRNSIDFRSNNEINFLSNFSNNYFSWCGFNIDTNSLDIYFNYEKYFNTESINSRLNSNLDYKYAFIMFNMKFLRLFASNVSVLVLDYELNSFQAIMRNFVDFFALSAIRFCLLTKLMPVQFWQNFKLQIKLVLNLCYWLNNRIDARLKQFMLKYFYSSFSLFKFLCLRTYLLILLQFNSPRLAHLIRLINVNLKKLNFIRCIKFDCEIYFLQLIELIQQQFIKFSNCKF